MRENARLVGHTYGPNPFSGTFRIIRFTNAVSLFFSNIINLAVRSKLVDKYTIMILYRNI